MSIVPNFILRTESERTIYECEIFCTVDEGEYNSTFNPTIRPNRDITREDVLPFVSSSYFNPYVTTIGLYNDDGQLLVIGKLAQAVKVPQKGDITFVVRFDI
jgi:hypothetical protein